MREELSLALSACGVIGFILFFIATFGMLVSDNVDMPHVALLLLVLAATVMCFVGAYLTGREEY